MMHMTFYWSRDVTLLVESWRTRSWTAYVLALLACFVSAALYQCLEAFRIGLKLRIHKYVHKSLRSSRATVDDGSSSPLLSKKTVSDNKWVSSLGRIAEGVFFGVNAAVGYLLMLAVMSFNGGVFVSIVCGLAAGYAAFRGGNDEDDEANKVVVSDENGACACA